MKSMVVSVAIAGFATGAIAQSGPMILAMTRAQAKGGVASQGAAVLRTGSATYDRYVRNGSFCVLQETACPAWVKTVDVAQCPVGAICRSIEIDNGAEPKRSGPRENTGGRGHDGQVVS
ncbi:hypothetical protein [Microvirga sp. 2TAF3]|uniref:hypothetical protein n=1 Tax=Microvirga sp. 2TAF3 TaxID=3233014 RepID=UPI003F9A8800